MGRSGWRKSSRSANQGQCVEARAYSGGFQVRDSKLANGPILNLVAADWAGFLAIVKR